MNTFWDILCTFLLLPGTILFICLIGDFFEVLRKIFNYTASLFSKRKVTDSNVLNLPKDDHIQDIGKNNLSENSSISQSKLNIEIMYEKIFTCTDYYKLEEDILYYTKKIDTLKKRTSRPLSANLDEDGEPIMSWEEWAAYQNGIKLDKEMIPIYEKANELREKRLIELSNGEI